MTRSTERPGRAGEDLISKISLPGSLVLDDAGHDGLDGSGDLVGFVFRATHMKGDPLGDGARRHQKSLVRGKGQEQVDVVGRRGHDDGSGAVDSTAKCG